jgi:hypothetical protein
MPARKRRRSSEVYPLVALSISLKHRRLSLEAQQSERARSFLSCVRAVRRPHARSIGGGRSKHVRGSEHTAASAVCERCVLASVCSIDVSVRGSRMVVLGQRIEVGCCGNGALISFER